MGVEIERKFLVQGDGWRGAVERSVRMAQGYLNDAGAVESGRQRASVRVRIAGDAAFLNLKSRELGHTRQEFDYSIPLEDARALLALCSSGLIDKTRHYVGRFEVDEFHGDNAGLVVAEIELARADEDFERPPWLGAEVTDLPRYYNLALAERPFARWTQPEKDACS